MNRVIENIIAQAKTLSPHERAGLIDRLVAELGTEDMPEDIEAAWLEVVERRADEVLSGRVKCIPLEDVEREIRQKCGFAG